MKKQNKIYLGIGIVVIILIAVITMFSAPKGEETIKIGYISALSGDAGVWGQSLKKGFDYGLNQYNAQENKKHTFEAVYEDDACDATSGVNAFNKVVNLQGINYVTGTVCSSVAMAVSNMVNDNNVIYVASAATNPDVVKQGETIFRLWPDDSYDAKAIAEYAVNDLSDTTFAIGYLNDNPIGLAVKDSFKETAENNRGEIIATADYTSKDSEFRTVATKLTSNNPDAIYIQTLPEQMPIFVKQIRDLNYEGDILLYGPSATSEGILDKISTKENLYYAVPDDVKQTEFWSNYQKKTEEEADSLVALGYDSFELIKDAVEKCGEDTECAKDYILSLKQYKTTRGTFGFDENGDVTQVPYKINKVE